MSIDHEHDHGFFHDLPKLIGRRRALAILGGSVAVAGSPVAASCVADARETAGPFPADGGRDQGGAGFNVLAESGVVRRDIRPSFAGRSGVADGVELDLEISVQNVSDGCAPLEGYAVYVWHCDAIGAYSLYENEANYLRGVAVTDTLGAARFTTVFPGCYRSRWPHIHFEVFASRDAMAARQDAVLIGQTSFDEGDCRQIYRAHPAYRNGMRNLRRNSVEDDVVFRNDSDAQMRQRTVEITEDGAVLKGRVVVGVEL